jgi:hypothetical protein
MGIESRGGARNHAPGLQSGALVPLSAILEPMAPELRERCRPIIRKPIEIAWTQFLSPFAWQWFATFTFAESVHPEAAAKRFSHWTKLLDESNGWSYRKRSSIKRKCVWVRGLEYQKRNVIHFHALVGNLPYELATRAQRDLWSSIWLNMGSTGFAAIRSIEEVGGVCGYISKYCAKGGEIDVSESLAAVGSQFAGV